MLLGGGLDDFVYVETNQVVADGAEAGIERKCTKIRAKWNNGRNIIALLFLLFTRI